MPRPAASRHDETARRLLDSAAAIIDSALVDDVEGSSRRVRTFHYPAALDWIRLEDVVRLAAPVSKKALRSRWETKDEFVRDAVLHAMLYRDAPEQDPGRDGPELQRLEGAASPSAAITIIADDLVEGLLAHPRSFLLAHVAPLFPRHPELRDEVRSASRGPQDEWTAAFPELLQRIGFPLRPDWTPERLTLAIQVMLDGYLVRCRVEPERLAQGWARASFFADLVVTFSCGALDVDGSRLASTAWLDTRRSAPRSSPFPA